VPIVKVISQSRMKKVLVTTYALATVILIAISASVTFSQVQAQKPSPTPLPHAVDGVLKNPDDTPLTTFEEEIRAKREIKIAEKEHEENLNRAREIGQIAKDLKDNFVGKSSLDRDCLKKIERLEKLTKKVRSEAGGEDEEMTITPRPTDLPGALKQIAEASETLSKDVEHTPRRVVSASVIANANVLLELIKLARGFVRPEQ
jgi:membrane-associated HD superfamily phosphohydrolase